MLADVTWVDRVQEKTEKCIYDLCYNPSGTQLIVAAGHNVLIYESNDGALVQLLKGHKDVVYCVCYAKDGKKFASGSADKTVIIWTSKLIGLLRYSHNESIQTMHFNPLSHQLLSCSISDFALWSAEQKAVQKFKCGGRVNCCAWTRDGQFMALGLAAGFVSIRNKTGEEQLRIESLRESPIWSLAWSPIRMDSTDIICIGEWSGKLSFYSLSGKLIGKERNFNFIPLKITYFPNGLYIAVCGSNKRCILLSNDGIQLATIGNTCTSWTWSCDVHPELMHIAIGCQDGSIINFELRWNVIHGLYKDKYAYRENMTDVIIQNLETNQKVRIKCKELIKKIAFYRDRLAVQLPERVMIYEPSGSSEDMHYRVREKLLQFLECSLLVMTNNLILYFEKRLQSISFGGSVKREWILDSSICCVKVTGGPIGQERLLAGLKNGQVVEIYLDSPFPIFLAQVHGAVQCIDMSLMKEKLAVVSDQGVLSVFDIHNNKKLIEFRDVDSVVFNSTFEEMLCFSGPNYLAVKIAKFVEFRQFSGTIIGLNGSKLHCLQGSSTLTIEMPLSSMMYQFLEAEMFQTALTVAYLGVAEADWLGLGVAALNQLKLTVAREAFSCTWNLRLVQVVIDLDEKLRSGDLSIETCQAVSCAALGRYREAARLYQRAGLQRQAVDMYVDLRMFDAAQELTDFSRNCEKGSLLRRQAEWARSMGEPRAAAEMFFAAGDPQSAVCIAVEYGWIDLLLKLGRELDRADRETLSRIAQRLRQLGASHASAEVFSRLGDEPDVADILVNAQAWSEALELAERNPQLKPRVYGPYANWLAESGRFSDAQQDEMTESKEKYFRESATNF
ncbi:intraflagellar transport protein 122 homolog [Copidosoma floridanum]|uniref:intraflagellar transport protein 122 homolog n=1 Tax=Copidosoma floridanum TaxID=29053 RepID=UPI000C6F9C79|nr:intraflagellar transport protein 122 homolog [Copidosoma floridanum]